MMKKMHVKFGLATVMSLGMLLSTAFGQIVTYNFDSLTPGALSTSTRSAAGNQDGWYLDQALTNSMIVESSAGGNRLTTTDQAGAYSARAIRNFGSSFFAGTETSAKLQFDLTTGANYAGGSIMVGGNGTANNYLSSDNAGVWGVQAGAVLVGSSLTFTLKGKASSGVGYGTAVTQTVTGIAGHTYSIQLELDFTAYSGAGSCTMYYKDVTAGGDFTLLSSISDVDLYLATGMTSGYNVANWNQVWLKLSENGSPLATIDNLYVAAPEPSAAILVCGGVLVLLGLNRTRRVS